MVDLDSIIEKTNRLKIEVKLIKVNQPSVKIVKKFN